MGVAHRGRGGWQGQLGAAPAGHFGAGHGQGVGGLGSARGPSEPVPRSALGFLAVCTKPMLSQPAAGSAAGVLGLPSPQVNPPNPNPNPNPHQDYKGLAWLVLGVANSDALLYDDEWQVLTLTQP